MNGIYSVFKKLNRLFAEVSGYLVALIVVLLLIDTMGYLSSFQVPMMIEMAVFTTIASAYLGLSFTEEIRGHVKVDAVITRLPLVVQHWIHVLWDIVGLVIIGLTTYAASLKAMESIMDGESIAGEVLLPLAPIRTVIAVSLLMYTIQIFFNLIRDLKSGPAQAEG